MRPAFAILRDAGVPIRTLADAAGMGRYEVGEMVYGRLRVNSRFLLGAKAILTDGEYADLCRAVGYPELATKGG